jgi:hypothetical protein
MESYKALQKVLLEFYSENPSISDQSMAKVLIACAALERDLQPPREDPRVIESFERLFYSLKPRVQQGGPSLAMQRYALKMELADKKRTEWALAYCRLALARDDLEECLRVEVAAREELDSDASNETSS